MYFRVKRGRCEIGSRMDEPGAYHPSMHRDITDVQAEDDQKQRLVGPEKILFLKSSSSAKITKEKSSSKYQKKKENRKPKKYTMLLFAIRDVSEGNKRMLWTKET
jgi:hypothetical protein